MKREYKVSSNMMTGRLHYNPGADAPKRTSLSGGAFWLGAALTFISGLPAAFATGVTTNVSFGSFFFSPKVVTISAGDTIVWTLASGIANHTVTGTGSDPFCGSGTVGSGCQHTFSTPGTFAYICATPGHAGLGMTGLVQVVPASIAPALLTDLARLPDGQFQFTIQNSPDHTNIIQASTSLAESNWVPIGTVVPGTNGFVFTDTNAASFGLRFYRVVEP
jgi:plastocyanin